MEKGNTEGIYGMMEQWNNERTTTTKAPHASPPPSSVAALLRRMEEGIKGVSALSALKFFLLIDTKPCIAYNLCRFPSAQRPYKRRPYRRHDFS